MLKIFLADYLEHYPVNFEDSEEAEQERGELVNFKSRIDPEWSGSKLPSFHPRKNRMSNDSKRSCVAIDPLTWHTFSGQCTKLNSETKLFGRGILVAKYIELLTRKVSPIELDYESQS